jgi:hypothetical protein
LTLTIRLKIASAEQTYRIFDQQGRTVKTGNLDGKQTTLELNGLSGMYYLMVGQEVVKVQVVR